MSSIGWESHHAITGLLYRYCELMDAADYDGLRELFANATVTNEGYDGEVVGGDAIVALYRRMNRVHEDGTLRTKHLTVNVVVEAGDDEDSAVARSVFVVFQATNTLPLQAIVTGRYRDRFVRTASGWTFAHRHIVVDQVGDVREHLHVDLAAVDRGPVP